IYMVEGYTDVISLHQNGVENVVATSGTSLTPGQARLVKRQTSNVTLLYDGDKAGIKAALRGVDVLLEADLNVRVVILPDGEDPDSYMQKVGTTAFTEYLEKTKQDFLFFKADLLLEEAGEDVAARSAAIRSSIATLALVDDPLKRANYLQQFTIKLGLEESLLVNLVNQAVADRREKVRKEQEREARRKDAQSRRSGRPAGQRPPRNKQLPPVRPTTNFPDEAPPPVDFGPPPPTESGDWPTEEPGAGSSGAAEYTPDWGGEEGYQEPAFDGFDADIPPPVSTVLPDRPADDQPGEADILWTGHTFQERGVCHLLIQHGHKPYDEATNTSVAAYFTTNIADVLEDFDGPLYKKIVTLVMDYVRQHQAGPSTEWFLNHPEESISKEAATAGVAAYQLSPNWKEKYGVRLSQKMPEENQKVAVDKLLNNFRLLKIERKIEFVQKEIVKANQAQDEKLVRKYFRLLTAKLLPIRNELAKQNESVVIKK
ncbi:MAG: toprim domain-containing protein, partial [Bacteroidota bacterium]